MNVTLRLCGVQPPVARIGLHLPTWSWRQITPHTIEFKLSDYEIKRSRRRIAAVGIYRDQQVSKG
jgi:hypothetical protein